MAAYNSPPMPAQKSAVCVAVLQFACGDDEAANLETAASLTREAVARGAQIVLPPELFSSPYFCKTQRADFLALATPLEESPAVARFRDLARELGVVIPVSFFERAGNARFNSLAMIDADGAVLGVYRKSHIPDGPGYSEKFYFSPGDSGFRVWRTRFAKIGAAICWDQWFPEAARAMALRGAEILLYPTAIGGEPHAPQVDSRRHWQNAMRGHAAANLVAVAAANRIGTESQTDAFGHSVEMSFYGHSFISGADGEIVAEAGGEKAEVICAEIDLAKNEQARIEWGVFRDRRPDLYGALATLDGGGR